MKKEKTTSEDIRTKLQHRIIELIVIHKGITHNELIRKIEKENLAKRERCANTLSDMLKENIIERHKGKGNTLHYYIEGLVEYKSLNYDEKFDKEIYKLRLLLDKIEKSFPDYYDFNKHNTFDMLKHVYSECEGFLQYHKIQDASIAPSEDGWFDDIKYYKKEKNDEVINEFWKEVRELYTNIKNSRKEAPHIIDRLIKAKSRSKGKLAEQLLVNLKTRKKHVDELHDIWCRTTKRVAYLNQNPEIRKLFL